MIATLARVLLNVALNLVYAFATLIPRNNKLWLFSAWQGTQFLDNPKFIYAWFLKNNQDIDALWLTKDSGVLEQMRLRGFPALSSYTLAGMWAQLRAGAVIFTHSVHSEFVSCLIASRVKRVQTWHGMPIKKIGYDDLKCGDPRRTEKIYTWLAPHMSQKLDLAIAAADADRSKYVSAFNVRPENVKITGYPRNDEIVRSLHLHASRGGVRAIYMPTFRGAPNSAFTLLRDSGWNFRAADERLDRLEVDLYIKVHPVQHFSPSDSHAITQSKRIHAVCNTGDIYEQVGAFDILITDFSGVYFDFLITGKPIIMAPFNIQSYIAEDRDLYYAYDDICPEPPCSTWDEVFDRIGAIRLDGPKPPGARYRQLQERFHRYLDAGSSERAAHEICRMMNVAVGTRRACACMTSLREDARARLQPAPQLERCAMTSTDQIRHGKLICPRTKAPHRLAVDESSPTTPDGREQHPLGSGGHVAAGTTYLVAEKGARANALPPFTGGR